MNKNKLRKTIDSNDASSTDTNIGHPSTSTDLNEDGLSVEALRKEVRKILMSATNIYTRSCKNIST